LSKVKDVLVQLYAGLSSQSCQVEVVLGSTHNVERAFVVLEVMFVTRSVGKANFNFGSLLDGTCVWFNSDILVKLSSPNEVKVELSVVLEKYLSDLFLVDEEFPKVERRSDSGSLGTLYDFLSWLTAEDLVVNLIAFSFDVQH
jgi:hypothetical protein